MPATGPAATSPPRPPPRPAIKLASAPDDAPRPRRAQLAGLHLGPVPPPPATAAEAAALGGLHTPALTSTPRPPRAAGGALGAQGGAAHREDDRSLSPSSWCSEARTPATPLAVGSVSTLEACYFSYRHHRLPSPHLPGYHTLGAPPASPSSAPAASCPACRPLKPHLSPLPPSAQGVCYPAALKLRPRQCLCASPTAQARLPPPLHPSPANAPAPAPAPAPALAPGGLGADVPPRGSSRGALYELALGRDSSETVKALASPIHRAYAVPAAGVAAAAAAASTPPSRGNTAKELPPLPPASSRAQGDSRSMADPDRFEESAFSEYSYDGEDDDGCGRGSGSGSALWADEEPPAAGAAVDGLGLGMRFGVALTSRWSMDSDVPWSESRPPSEDGDGDGNGDATDPEAGEGADAGGEGRGEEPAAPTGWARRTQLGVLFGDCPGHLPDPLFDLASAPRSPSLTPAAGAIHHAVIAQTAL